ncbi:hypothetical protein ACFOQM_05005 [Paenibacillus sp. GCM10012307]|uniref:Sporulation protein n=1 Tax=Paenibacillus roseus TaxID=2798579 RepID=A0A934J4H9_9BACL|nr:hypothetical protein [Paenibacillus roseus]MBJ6360666.1 hypothetical protein [Paenibacillus roseus]
MLKSARVPGFLIIALVLCIMLLGGCTNSGSTRNGVKTYGHDGYMGLSNSNPNLPLGNSNYYSYSSDVKFMKEKLSELPGIEKSSFTIHDPDIDVRIRPQAHLDEYETNRLREQSWRLLQENMPRYRIHVYLQR